MLIPLQGLHPSPTPPPPSLQPHNRPPLIGFATASPSPTTHPSSQTSSLTTLNNTPGRILFPVLHALSILLALLASLLLWRHFAINNSQSHDAKMIKEERERRHREKEMDLITRSDDVGEGREVVTQETKGRGWWARVWRKKKPVVRGGEEVEA
ncbi:hypothetical protein MMC08_008298 [Hypocenomyce scalaris]|nr:hypothetical protein [Hypocenomyce scalaris]